MSGGRDRHVVSFRRLAGASCVRRIERPLSSMRCASWSRRSQMASAWLGSPMTACQSVTGSWLAMSVAARSARSSMTSVRSRRSGSRSGASIQSSMASRSSLARRASSRV